LGRSHLGRQIDQLLGRARRKPGYWPLCRLLSSAAAVILFAAVCLLFLVILATHPGRALVVVLFLLFLALLGLVC
jgi:hypothetical protein